MKGEFWEAVSENLQTLASEGVLPNSPAIDLNHGQKATIRALAERLPKHGVIVADEVGMGKTRVAAAVAKAVVKAGGRVAIVVPPGLGYQWFDELRQAAVYAPQILRSLDQFLAATWDRDGKGAWFEEKTLIVSSAFPNWRLGERAAPWRWRLLPELTARWDNSETEGVEYDWSHQVRCAAESIAQWIDRLDQAHPARKRIAKLLEDLPWCKLLSPEDYGQKSDSGLRSKLELAVGLGLGAFDLVIIDEAHKSRDRATMLNRLLDRVLLPMDACRRLALTATPVELDADQWVGMLERIQIAGDAVKTIEERIRDYMSAVAEIQRSPEDESQQLQFSEAAKAFEEALKPYVLRRDKRSDPMVQKFCRRSGMDWNAYREEREIVVDTQGLSQAWKRAVCAAEALSFVTNGSAQRVKRARLTIGSGHGIASLLDEQGTERDEDRRQLEDEQRRNNETSSDHTGTLATQNNKRAAREKWWRSVLASVSKSGTHELFDHPAIVAAAGHIDTVCQRNEKVLVFGRFTRPLRALTQLLNAREMLRSWDKDHAWPQASIDNDMVGAVQSAHHQLGRAGELDVEALKRWLETNYKRIETQSAGFRRHLLENLKEGMASTSVDKKVTLAFWALQKRTSTKIHTADALLPLVARALQELMPDASPKTEPKDYAQAFAELILASGDRDEMDWAQNEASEGSDDGSPDDVDNVSDPWEFIKARLEEEYGTPKGGYARLMNGNTKPTTRRFLQLAFNRRKSFLRVLVTQSVVGREGVNLHKACRTVVLLHPEWNPGVVEQQIGRVDRLGGLWSQLMEAVPDHEVSTEPLPKIEICPVIFSGTYDEVHWQVLRQRWNDLRAQLHGMILSPKNASSHGCSAETAKKINADAPSFSPA